MFLETKWLKDGLFCCLTVQNLSLWRLPTSESALFIISFPPKVSEADLFPIAHPLIILLGLSRNGRSITVGVLSGLLGWGWVQWVQGGVWKLTSCEAKHRSSPHRAGWELSHRTRDIICAWFMCVFGLVSAGSRGRAAADTEKLLTPRDTFGGSFSSALTCPLSCRG